jgi:hypothetical protein
MIRALLGIRIPLRKLALEGQLTPSKGSNKAAELNEPPNSEVGDSCSSSIYWVLGREERSIFPRVFCSVSVTSRILEHEDDFSTSVNPQNLSKANQDP